MSMASAAAAVLASCLSFATSVRSWATSLFYFPAGGWRIDGGGSFHGGSPLAAAFAALAALAFTPLGLGWLSPQPRHRERLSQLSSMGQL